MVGAKAEASPEVQPVKHTLLARSLKGTDVTQGGGWMSDGLRDVLSIAAEGGSRTTTAPGTPHKVALLRTVAAAAPKPTSASGPEVQQLGRGGLRQAFWLCGFHEVLREREQKGECLTAREQSLLALSQTDFLTIRSAVIDLAMQRLNAVVHGPGILPEPGEQQPSVTEMFAVETVRNLALHGRQAMLDAGPDAALSLFGGNENTIEPLAIFQLVFSAALGLAETFERLRPGRSTVVARLSNALDAEIGRI
jgi:hypothetical protein